MSEKARVKNSVKLPIRWIWLCQLHNFASLNYRWNRMIGRREEGGDSQLKEWACIQVSHHKDVPKNIKDMQESGWRLHTYQATGYGADVKHYLLFEKD